MKKKLAGVFIFIFILLPAGIYFTNYWKAYGFSGDYNSRAYQDTGIPFEVKREMEQFLRPDAPGIEAQILLPRRHYSREALFKVMKWYAEGHHRYKLIIVVFYTDPNQIPDEISPILPTYEVSAFKTEWIPGWGRFMQRTKLSHDAVLSKGTIMSEPEIVSFGYRPVLWLPFYWRTQQFDSISELR
jgi:hypothetical protein